VLIKTCFTNSNGEIPDLKGGAPRKPWREATLLLNSTSKIRVLSRAEKQLAGFAGGEAKKRRAAMRIFEFISFGTLL
jgi:hypothetical protein